MSVHTTNCISFLIWIYVKHRLGQVDKREKKKERTT